VRSRLFRSAAVLVLVGSPVVAGCSLRRAAGPPPSPYCRPGNVLEGVYHPERLEIRSHCRVAAGVVERVKFESFDGDVHVDLSLDERDSGLLGSGNDRLGGTLVVEIIPQDRGLVAVPEVGTRVEVVGPWVEDTTHGWREIHPAWFVSAGRIVAASPEELRRVRELLSGAVSDPDD
jgi:hypothetical protein